MTMVRRSLSLYRAWQALLLSRWVLGALEAAVAAGRAP
jgi:hypothetical protein